MRWLGFSVWGLLLLAIGVEVRLRGDVDLGTRLGLSEQVIGLTIMAAGTGAPEVVVSAARGRADMAVANVIGSNLFNLLGFLSLSSFIAPLRVAVGVRDSDSW